MTTIPDTPIYDPNQDQPPSDPAAATRRLRIVMHIVVPTAMTVILASIIGFIVVFADAADKAAFHSAKTTISANLPELSANLAETALAQEGLTPAQTAPYVAQAKIQEPNIHSCHRMSQTRYRITIRCFLTLHLQTPTQVSLDGTHTVEIQRARGFTWAFQKLPVLSQRPGARTSAETYGQPLTP